MKKATVNDNALELYNEYLEIYFDEYKAFSNAKKGKSGNKYDPIILFLKTYNYNIWFENQKSTDTTSRKSNKDESVDLSDMSPLEGDEEQIKKGK